MPSLADRLQAANIEANGDKLPGRREAESGDRTGQETPTSGSRTSGTFACTLRMHTQAVHLIAHTSQLTDAAERMSPGYPIVILVLTICQACLATFALGLLLIHPFTRTLSLSLTHTNTYNHTHTENTIKQRSSRYC
ncbi:unnamed protein product [Protopolystoma xenopodis]|uniref:Uncharacterized protein n=1 Tax=Protopolystoma xenopodis TaxID=117903 RepID=A0A448XP52_9PLAT|nr:unnamed protein product [Protopolystoma xenopodis]